MACLVRDLHADHVKQGARDYAKDFVARTAAIVALLPHPRISEARAIAAQIRGIHDTIGAKIAAGEWDDHPLMRAALAAFDTATRETKP